MAANNGTPPPGVIDSTLGQLTLELHKITAVLHDADVEARAKRRAAKRAEAVAFLNAEGPMDVRKRLALIAAEQAEGEADVAEAALRHLRDRVHEIDQRIDVGRTYASTARSELKTLGYGGP